MALVIQDLSDDIRDNLITNFAWPVFDQAELEKFTDAVAKSVVDHIVANAVLNNATLDSTAVTVDSVTHLGNVDDGAVSGGII